METGWAIFGNKSVKVRIARDGLALFGDEIPRKCPLFFSDYAFSLHFTQWCSQEGKNARRRMQYFLFYRSG